MPWVAAWSDAVAISGLLILLAVTLPSLSANGHLSWQLAAIAGISGAVLLLQVFAGKMLYIGDALTAILYIGSWIMAVIVGRRITTTPNKENNLSVVLGSWLLAALLSIGVALAQWTDTLELGIYVADLPPGGRPFSNLAQPNNFSTLCFLGLCVILWFFQAKRIGRIVFWLGVWFLLTGIIMSQSRTGMLQVGALTVWALLFRTHTNLRISRMQVVALCSLFVAGVLLWPNICEWLLLPQGRLMSETVQAGVRLPYWLAMLDAIGREPLLGYGWQQVGLAQQRVALDHPTIPVLFEHSHNLLLDLLLWNGIPIGGLIAILLMWWSAAHIRACRRAEAVWLLAIVGGILLHSMLELPLEYAYFLIPLGFTMGAIEGLLPSASISVHPPRWLLILGTILLSLLFLRISHEYLIAEENFRTLREESAHIGVSRIVTPAPQLKFLTQLQAFLEFTRTEATTDMTADQIEWMRKVSERFGYAPVLFRYALAAGLNGRQKDASDTLTRICRIHELVRCREAHDGWIALQERYPQLATIAPPAGPVKGVKGGTH